MALSVVSFCTYLTNIHVPWRGVDHDTRDFIHAIKDRDFSGYSHVLVGKKYHRFDNSNRQDVVGHWAEMVAAYFAQNPPSDGLLVLAPVPGSKHDVKFEGQPRTAVLAEAIAARLNANGFDVTVLDALRWDAPMPSAHEEGGTRDPGELFAKCVLQDDVTGFRVVLVDDVLTSGGHLQACAATLRAGGANVEMAFCAGRADQSQVPDPWAIRHDQVEDYAP